MSERASMEMLKDYYEAIIGAPVRHLRSKTGITGTAPAQPSKVKDMCTNGVDSCSSRYKEYDRESFQNEGQFLAEILRAAGDRRRRGTFRPESIINNKGCTLREGVAEECSMNMLTDINPCNWHNIATSTNISDSSYGNSLGNLSYAVDLNEGTSYQPLSSGGEYWLTVDLGKEKDLCRTEIKMQIDALATYAVQGSLDGNAWVEFSSQTWGYNDWEGFEFPIGSRGRWVRVFSSRPFSIYEIELYSRSVRFERRLQADTSALYPKCANGKGSQTACCEACFECKTLSCAFDLPNCTRLLSVAHTNCYTVSIDMFCCKAIWWGFSTIGFMLALCCMACFCMFLKRERKRKEMAAKHGGVKYRGASAVDTYEDHPGGRSVDTIAFGHVHHLQEL